jgi:CBS domain-containing protein
MAKTVRDVMSPAPRKISADDPVQRGAQVMRDENIGDVLVMDGDRLVGILTDRDIVVAVIAVPGARPEGIRVGDAMTTDLATAREDDGLFEIVQRMSERTVRRLPVVGADGSLKGIVTLDDVLRVLGAELGQLGEALRWGRMREREKRAKL